MEVTKLQSIFLVSVSFVYLWAFSSLYIQIPGLYGDNGVTPARSVLKCQSKNISECVFFGERPTLLHLVFPLNLTPMQGLDLLCLTGIVLSSLSIIFSAFCDTFVYLILWIFYFSCFQVGQTFLWFQWDTLLLETGFLTVLVAPCKLTRTKHTRWMPQDNVTLFLVRWLAFRLMFASGVVKLTSECPTWWGLTALNYHYESQCIPTQFAWYTHQLPEWFQKLSVVLTYVIEIFIPPLFLMPIRHLRVFAFILQAFFMILIIITGNYNFFNLLTVALCSTMLVKCDDSKLSSKVIEKTIPKLYFTFKWIIIGLVYFFLVYFTVKLFNLRIVGLTVQSEITFSKSQFYETLAYFMPKLLLLGSICFSLEIITALSRCVLDFYKKSVLTMVWVFLQCSFMCGICVLMFCISLVPISYLDRKTHSNLWQEVRDLHAVSDGYQLTHSYGLFRSMTGVGGRPEVIMEASDNLNGPWKEYEFRYKPGSLNGTPPFIIPHQPRLDWQMWFAALGSYQHNAWFISFVYKLLKNEGQVLKLINKNPFPDKPPKFIRAQLYHYHFTSWYQTDKNYHTRNWWWKDFQHEYMPPISLDNVPVVNFLKENELLIDKPRRPAKSKLTSLLRTVRQYTSYVEPSQFVWHVEFAVVIIAVCKDKMMPAPVGNTYVVLACVCFFRCFCFLLLLVKYLAQNFNVL